MFKSNPIISRIHKALWIGALLCGVAGNAHAEAYDFNEFLRGGGGGGDPQKQRIARGMGAHICVDVRQGSAATANSVLFTVWSAIPQRNSRLTTIVFDTGRHADLFNRVSVITQSPGLKAQVLPGRSHAFLYPLTPDYWIGISKVDKLRPGDLAAGLAPGQTILLSATLAAGKTFSSVISALNEGLNPATAPSGLRIGVIVIYLLGGPPPGVGTIHDDGGFVINSASSRCRYR